MIPLLYQYDLGWPVLCQHCLTRLSENHIVFRDGARELYHSGCVSQQPIPIRPFVSRLDSSAIVRMRRTVMILLETPLQRSKRLSRRSLIFYSQNLLIERMKQRPCQH